MQHTVTHCSLLQLTAPNCNTLRHRRTCSTDTSIPTPKCNTLQLTATHCTTLHNTATHCNTDGLAQPIPQYQQKNATHCNSLQHTAPYCTTLQHTATQTDLLNRYLNTNKKMGKRMGCYFKPLHSLPWVVNVLQCVAVCCSVLQCVAV